MTKVTTINDKALSRLLSGTRLHSAENPAIQLQKILLGLSEYAHLLFFLAVEGKDIDDFLRGEMQAYAKIISDIAGNLSSAMEFDCEGEMCRCGHRI